MRRVALIIAGVIGLALVIFVGKQYSHYQTPLSKDAVRIGTIPDFPTACRVAFPLLVAKLRSDPSASTVAVDWHPQTFARYLFSLDPPDSGFCELYYDRASRRFAAFEPVNGPTYFDWREVTPAILMSVSDSHASFTDLSSYGCYGALP